MQVDEPGTIYVIKWMENTMFERIKNAFGMASEGPGLIEVTSQEEVSTGNGSDQSSGLSDHNSKDTEASEDFLARLRDIRIMTEGSMKDDKVVFSEAENALVDDAIRRNDHSMLAATIASHGWLGEERDAEGRPRIFQLAYPDGEGRVDESKALSHTLLNLKFGGWDPSIRDEDGNSLAHAVAENNLAEGTIKIDPSPVSIEVGDVYFERNKEGLTALDISLGDSSSLHSYGKNKWRGRRFTGSVASRTVTAQAGIFGRRAIKEGVDMSSFLKEGSLNNMWKRDVRMLEIASMPKKEILKVFEKSPAALSREEKAAARAEAIKSAVSRSGQKTVSRAIARKHKEDRVNPKVRDAAARKVEESKSNRAKAVQNNKRGDER
jgi:hypothetical protein